MCVYICVCVYISVISYSVCQSLHRRHVKKLGGRTVTHGNWSVESIQPQMPMLLLFCREVWLNSREVSAEGAVEIEEGDGICG